MYKFRTGGPIAGAPSTYEAHGKTICCDSVLGRPDEVALGRFRRRWHFRLRPAGQLIDSMARPVAQGLFATTDAGVVLLAGRNRTDGRMVFPLPAGADFEPVRLSGAGTLWSWTVQRFPPKAPFDGPVGESFVPYAVGYVEFHDQLIVEGRIVAAEFDRLHIGMRMAITTDAYRRDPDGAAVLTYAFRPLNCAP